MVFVSSWSFLFLLRFQLDSDRRYDRLMVCGDVGLSLRFSVDNGVSPPMLCCNEVDLFMRVGGDILCFVSAWWSEGSCFFLRFLEPNVHSNHLVLEAEFDASASVPGYILREFLDIRFVRFQGPFSEDFAFLFVLDFLHSSIPVSD